MAMYNVSPSNQSSNLYWLEIKNTSYENINISTLPYDFNLGCAVVFNNEIHILGSKESGNNIDCILLKFTLRHPYKYYLSFF